ncbi:centrosomal protein of 83 kDa-like isoform X4 [Cyprinodon tularosa]|uniref:centrosomal protein of 83 kDa-like isoform X4 n=1 Tax=Cyprinodon tularosa TaxID=77115 RepID=UPI0018E23123|nr:centrosomal protein of 83 kDa-like isoform X4 [Cyprinodon tularosa]
MRSTAFFLMMVCCSVSGSRSEVSAPVDFPAMNIGDLRILWDELQGLKKLVLSLKGEEVERRQELRSVESRLRDGEVVTERQRQSLDELRVTVGHRLDELRRDVLTEQNSDLKRKVEELEVQTKGQGLLDTGSTAQADEILELQLRINSSESSMENLKMKSLAVAAELPFLQTRLRASERVMEQLRRKDAVLASRMCSTETLMEDLKGQISDIQASNSSSASEAVMLEQRLEIHLDGLRTNIEDQVHELKNKFSSSQLSLEGRSASAENRLTDAERQQDELRKTNAEVESRLRSSEKQLEDLKTTNTDMLVRFGYTEGKLEQLKNLSEVLEVRLIVSERRLEDLKTNNSEFDTKLSDVALSLQAAEQQLVDLKQHSSVRAAELAFLAERLTAAQRNSEAELKVAFSVGLTDSGIVGPFEEETTLIFSKTITNIGQGYNSSSGVFTAPVRGLYFFSFTAADYQKGYMGLYLYRNQQPVLFSLDLNDHGGYTSTTSVVVLQLEGGDIVRLALPASYRLYDDSRSFSVFSGFLLFPV